MATINFDVSVSLSNESTIHFETSAYYDIAFDSMETYINNTKTTATGENFTFPALNVLGVKTLDFLSADFQFSPATFPDGVYYTENYYYDGTGDTYQSLNRLLVTTAIDAGIAAYTPTTPIEAANLVWMNYLRGQITELSTDLETNETLINTLIDRIEVTLVTPETITTLTNLSNVTPSEIGIVAINENEFTTPLNSPSNYVQNTITGDYVAYEDSFLLATASGNSSVSSADTFFSSIYPDAVYFVYNFAGNNFSEPTIRLARYYNAIVVTSTIDALFATFEANYDPNNADQLASYQAMLTAYAQIATLSSDIPTNYAAINAQIEIIQDNLALWVNLSMSLTLTAKDVLTLAITTTLPNTTYTNQSLVLSNTNDDAQEYTSSSFPATYVDTTKTMTSSDIDFGTQYEDGVYKANLSWSAGNGMEFSGVAYEIVTTQIDCGIAQIIAKRPNCKQLQSKLNHLMAFKSMAEDAFANQDYTTCNFYINKCIIILNQNGCGCGCN